MLNVALLPCDNTVCPCITCLQECVGGVLAKTTRVLVTHQLQFLPLADRVVVMRGGRISAEGTFEELQARGINFQQLTIQAQEGKEAPPAPEPEPQTTPLPTSVVRLSPPARQLVCS